MLDLKTEGIWPCFVYLGISEKSRDSIYQWIADNLPSVIAETLTANEMFSPLPKADLHISLTPTLLLQKHEKQMLKGLVNAVGSNAHFNQLKYERETHLRYLANTECSELRSSIQPFQLPVGSLSVLGEYLVFELDPSREVTVLYELNEYFRQTCAFFHQETYEEKFSAGAKQRVFHCSVCRITASEEDIEKLKKSLENFSFTFSTPLEVSEIVIVN
ncbi:hypothetical protein XU18_1340 [Perkinsela sp. CCAP 1560/4]|nr:hypothetical protein XU18_1340 [Perkinsela sp. CCAP 1560/4]|eukprot:KNH08010.1 hypothetical protein XU18_1340 [Perkinsela sp. CCAP 1560/4]